MNLITLQQAKDQLRLTHAFDDARLEGMIAGASRATVTYLKDFADTFLDTSGEPIEERDSSDVVVNYLVPDDVKMAVKIAVAEWFKNSEGKQDGEVDPQFGYGYPLPRAAIALLYPYRTPTLR